MRLISQVVAQAFPAPIRCRGMGRICTMTLASLVNARAWISDSFAPGHVIRQSFQVWFTENLRRKLEEDPTFVVVTYPWEDNRHVYTGIPPHVALLQEISIIKNNTQDLINNFGNRVQTALAAQGYGPNHLTAEGLRAILQEFRIQLRVEILDRAVAAEAAAMRGVDEAIPRNQPLRLRGELNERREDGRVYNLFMHHGLFRRVPATWRFPRCNTMLLWRKWWIGEDERRVPPLRNIRIKDVNHLDNMPMEDWESSTTRPGRNPVNIRRKATKNLSDMKYLMELIEKLVTEANIIVEEITISTVDRMFAAVQDRLVVAARDAQKMWTTVVTEQRTKERAGRRMSGTGNENELRDGGGDGDN